MGVYQSIYIGPYLTVNNKIIDTTKNEVMCPNCQKKVSHKFCQDCGTETDLLSVPIKTTLFPFYFLIENKMDNQLWAPNIDIKGKSILVPNDEKGRPYKVNIETDRGCSDVKSLSKFDQKADMDWFISKNKEIISLLENEFGKVEFDWGIVIDWS